MEKDDEVKGEGNSINYEDRMQDTRVGRFLSIDPLAKSFPHYSPYQFAGNTPIQAIDLDGAEEYHYLAKWDKESGKITFKLEKEKTVTRRTFLCWSWTPSEEHTVVFQNSSGEKTEYVFTKTGKLIQIEGPTSPGTILNTSASLRKFASNSTKIKYQNEQEAENAFGNKFISEGGETAFTFANATIVGSQFYTPSQGRTRTPIEENVPTISTIKSREIIIDENLSPKIATQLKEAGYTVKVFEKGTLDSEIIQYAKDNKAIVVTQNIKDFKNQGINTMKASATQTRTDKVDEVVNAIKTADKTYKNGNLPSNISLSETANKK